VTARTSVLLSAAAALSVCAGCESSTGPVDPGGASYSAGYAPGRLVYATLNCDRLLTYAILSLGRSRREFDLSVNIVEDCSRAGAGYAYWGVLILGDYMVTDSVLAFAPDSPSTPAFTGTFDGAYVTLELPVRSDSLAPTPVTVQLGPRAPF
jgi:hypothetical protein